MIGSWGRQMQGAQEGCCCEDCLLVVLALSWKEAMDMEQAMFGPVTRMTTRHWGRVALIFLVMLGALALGGCLPLRQRIKLPSPKAPLEERQRAYERYKLVGIQIGYQTRWRLTPYGYRRETSARRYLVLGNGDRLRSMALLMGAVGPQSETALALKEMHALAKQSIVIMWGGFGATIGIGILLPLMSFLPPDPYFQDQMLMPLLVAGASIVLLGSLTSLIWGLVVGSKAIRAQRHALINYNADLRENLGLNEPSPAKPKASKKKPPTTPSKKPPLQ